MPRYLALPAFGSRISDRGCHGAFVDHRSITLPDKVAALRALLPTTGPDTAALASHFGKRSKSRLTEITQILDTLRSLGQL